MRYEDYLFKQPVRRVLRKIQLNSWKSFLKNEVHRIERQKAKNRG